MEYNDDLITVVKHTSTKLGLPLHTKCTYHAVLWYTGGVPVYGDSPIPFMGQRGHLYFGRNAQFASASIHVM